MRAVREAASARVIESAYIGCQRVDDPQRTDGPALYYQARFWARVELDAFLAAPRRERPARRCPGRTARQSRLGLHAGSARIILDEGLRIERQHEPAPTETE
ncbi:MAG: hypothetical protein U0841_14965 [Chloroflexia bacterium]